VVDTVVGFDALRWRKPVEAVGLGGTGDGTVISASARQTSAEEVRFNLNVGTLTGDGAPLGGFVGEAFFPQSALGRSGESQ
jgi:hypothetical protein